MSLPGPAPPIPQLSGKTRPRLHPRPPTSLAQVQHLWVPLALLGQDGAAQLEAHVFQEPLPGHKRLPLCRHQRVEGAVGNLPVLRHSASHRGAPAPTPGRAGPTPGSGLSPGAGYWVGSTHPLSVLTVRTNQESTPKARHRQPRLRVPGCQVFSSRRPGTRFGRRHALWPSFAQEMLKAPAAPLSPTGNSKAIPGRI